MKIRPRIYSELLAKTKYNRIKAFAFCNQSLTPQTHIPCAIKTYIPFSLRAFPPVKKCNFPTFFVGRPTIKRRRTNFTFIIYQTSYTIHAWSGGKKIRLRNVGSRTYARTRALILAAKVFQCQVKMEDNLELRLQRAVGDEIFVWEKEETVLLFECLLIVGTIRKIM